MRKKVPHIVISCKVWTVEANRVDNGNLLYYRVWADNRESAIRYLKNHDLKDVEVVFKEPREADPDLPYDCTVNCFHTDPARYKRWTGQFAYQDLP